MVEPSNVKSFKTQSVYDPFQRLKIRIFLLVSWYIFEKKKQKNAYSGFIRIINGKCVELLLKRVNPDMAIYSTGYIGYLMLFV